jgi:SpoIIAA-like
MPVELKELINGTLLEVHLTGTLVKQDYETLVPAVERLAQHHRTINMLVTMHDFHGWTVGALWEDTKFALHHFRDVKRLAMVGETKWQEELTKFFRPFTTAPVRYFESSQAPEALDWLTEL